MKRGFTLIEVMVSLAISSVIIAGATSAIMSIDRQIADTSRRTKLQSELMRLEEFLIANVEGAGGGQIRPAVSALPEDAQTAAGNFKCRTIVGITNCAASGTNSADRLTLVTLHSSFPGSCSVPLLPVGTTLIGNTVPSCCLSAAMNGKQALLVGTTGAVSVVLSAFNAGSCSITAGSGQAQQILTTTLATAGYPANLVITNVATTFLDESTHTLKQWSDANGNFQAESTEISTVDDEVFEFQVAAGYDGNPEDGVVTDASSTGDEWLFNANGDPAGPGTVATSFAGISAGQLRELQVAVAVGTVSQVRANNNLKLLNNTTTRTKAGFYLSSSTSKAFLRNLDVFTQ